MIGVNCVWCGVCGCDSQWLIIRKEEGERGRGGRRRKEMNCGDNKVVVGRLR